MIRLNSMIILIFLLPNFLFSQYVIESSNIKTIVGEVKIPENWNQLNSMDDSGQTYLKNKDGVIIAIAQNPKKTYSFFNSEKLDFENVKEFYKWDSDYKKNKSI